MGDQAPPRPSQAWQVKAGYMHLMGWCSQKPNRKQVGTLGSAQEHLWPGCRGPRHTALLGLLQLASDMSASRPSPTPCLLSIGACSGSCRAGAEGPGGGAATQLTSSPPFLRVARPRGWGLAFDSGRMPPACPHLLICPPRSKVEAFLLSRYLTLGLPFGRQDG